VQRDALATSDPMTHAMASVRCTEASHRNPRGW